MITASRLAGFFAAHAVWCVSEGATLIPMLVYTTAEDERKMERLLIRDDLGASIEFGKQRLVANAMDASDAALLYDGRLPLGDEKVDAVIIEIRTFFSPRSEAVVAVPYTPKDSGKFRVHKPKLLAWEHCDDFDLDAAFESFFEGVDEHEEGSLIWSESLDESK